MAKTKQQKAREALEREQRRKTVAANIIAGSTYREIATALDVSLGTVANDFKAVLKEWRDHYSTKIDKWLDIQLRRYDVMLNGLWDDARKGDLAKMDRVLKIMEAQSKLLGLDKEIAIRMHVEGEVQHEHRVTADRFATVFQKISEREKDVKRNRSGDEPIH